MKCKLCKADEFKVIFESGSIRVDCIACGSRYSEMKNPTGLVGIIDGLILAVEPFPSTLRDLGKLRDIVLKLEQDSEFQKVWDSIQVEVGQSVKEIARAAWEAGRIEKSSRRPMEREWSIRREDRELWERAAAGLAKMGS